MITEQDLMYDTPIAVDLDGTLIRSDLLWESLIRLAFKSPMLLFFVPYWLIKGKAVLKNRLADAASIDVANLPYNEELLAYLQRQRLMGRDLYLSTGAASGLAEKVATHLGIFEGVFASKVENLTGSAKARVLLQRFGEKAFTYAGNESEDFQIWQYARSAISVDLQPKSVEALKKLAPTELVLCTRRQPVRTLLKAMRIHQWAKNLLIFVPLVTSHSWRDPYLVLMAFNAFLVFGVCASATYFINDLSDLDADRQHKSKRNRPLASGALSIPAGVLLLSTMLATSFAIAAWSSFLFLMVLLLYTGITLGYSFMFKRLQTLDILVLAALYTVRIIAGAAAIQINPSFWLLAFSMFIFLSLACVKRISEINQKQADDGVRLQIAGRGYFTTDLPVMLGIAIGAGLVSILVFALYVNSPDVIGLYAEPRLLWLICPVLGYWIIRVLIMAARGEIDEDPISFAIRDRNSWIAGACVFILVLIASIPETNF